MKLLLEKYNKIIFALVALLFLYPTFQKGYIFLLDWGVTPNFKDDFKPHYPQDYDEIMRLDKTITWLGHKHFFSPGNADNQQPG